MNKDEPSARDALWRMTNTYQASQAIHVADTLGIADLLEAGPRSADELAEATGTHAPTLYRLLRALASVGVFQKVHPILHSLATLSTAQLQERRPTR